MGSRQAELIATGKSVMHLPEKALCADHLAALNEALKSKWWSPIIVLDRDSEFSDHAPLTIDYDFEV